MTFVAFVLFVCIAWTIYLHFICFSIVHLFLNFMYCLIQHLICWHSFNKVTAMISKSHRFSLHHVLKISVSSTNASAYRRWRHIANSMFHNRIRSAHSFFMHRFGSSTSSIWINEKTFCYSALKSRLVSSLTYRICHNEETHQSSRDENTRAWRPLTCLLIYAYPSVDTYG